MASTMVMENAFRNLFRVLNSTTSEMILDGKRVPNSILPEFSKFQNGLEKLSLIDCDLWSLDGFPYMPNLRVLMLGDNHLDNIDIIADKCPNLVKLSLVNNKLAFRDDLELLTRLTHLRSLDVEANALCDIRGHDRWLADKFPTVTRFIITAYDTDTDDDSEEDWELEPFICDESPLEDSDNDGQQDENDQPDDNAIQID
ncbi:putative acidic leucine-rich nuclear phosphoprotein 32 family member C [Paramacrobiotus metropolitanus]|uniref:putative acidic leucine-rich nuclear phosphoprotein 32 family member C n=1 Tax=Paramacrobiotus metropolitanus TaxID=2943436 RepID=UPI002445CDE1|nr:putative acidic leucine-rich nuclear phosphoprotein 32 family member C [Paramacrobiotus metropolitanus]